MMLWIEGGVALAIALIIFVSSFFQFDAAHLGGDAFAVRFGALLQGVLYGGVVAFVMVPLRLQVMSGAPRSLASYNSWFGALALIYVIRSGIVARMPVIGHPFRAYRIASLRRGVDINQKRIARLQALDRAKEPKS